MEKVSLKKVCLTKGYNLDTNPVLEENENGAAFMHLPHPYIFPTVPLVSWSHVKTGRTVGHTYSLPYGH